MMKTDLFRVVIKIFGIYCFINFLFQLIPTYSVSWGFDSFNFFFSLIQFVTMGLITFLLLFKTDTLIKVFRIDKGFDNKVIVTKDVNAKGIFKFALIIIGLSMIVDNISQLLTFCYLAFKNQISVLGIAQTEDAVLNQYLDYNRWITSGLNVLIGIIILTNFKWISELFMKQEKKQ